MFIDHLPNKAALTFFGSGRFRYNQPRPLDEGEKLTSRLVFHADFKVGNLFPASKGTIVGILATETGVNVATVKSVAVIPQVNVGVVLNTKNDPGLEHYVAAFGLNLVKAFTATSQLSLFSGLGTSGQLQGPPVPMYNTLESGPRPTFTLRYQIKW